MWSGWEISRTVSRHLVEQLKAWGVKQVYGVIGDANAPFFDELGKQEEIKLIPCRSEMAAALMASAEAKLTGRPAVCTATSGPGAALLLAGLGDAAADRVPVLAVTGQVERHKLGTGSKQEMDQQLLFASVADYSVLVAGGKGFPEQLNLAMKTAVARAGVAHLSIPKDVWKEKAEGLLFPFPETAPLPRPEKERIRAAVELIDQSERPVILAGRGVKQAAEAVLRLAERIQAPLIVTMPEHGLIPQDHPWFVGGLGQAGSEAATELLLETDLCLVLGATWWPEAFVPKSVPVIQVDAVPENIGLRFPCKAAVVGDMREAVAALLESTRVKNDESRARRVADKRDEWRRRVKEEREFPGWPFHPARVMHAVGCSLPEEAIVAVDVGEHTLWFERSAPLSRQTVLISGRWRTLGFSLPAAMAAGLVQPGSKAVAIAGDGGFLTTGADLVTAVGLGLPLTVIVLADRSYALERHQMEAEGLKPAGTDLFNPDFVAWARAMGAEGIRIRSEDELEPLLAEAIASNRTTLVEIPCVAVKIPALS